MDLRYCFNGYMDKWNSPSMLSLDTTKIHGSEVSMRCCTSSGLCFSRWAWVEYCKAFWRSGCVVYGYEMLWNAINPSCFAGYLRGIYFGCRCITSTSYIIYQLERWVDPYHIPKKGLSSSGFFLPRCVTACWINVRVVEKVMTCLEGRSTFIEPVQMETTWWNKKSKSNSVIWIICILSDVNIIYSI